MQSPPWFSVYPKKLSKNRLPGESACPTKNTAAPRFFGNVSPAILSDLFTANLAQRQPRLAQFHSVFHQLQAVVAFGGQKRFGVELHGFDGQIAMAHAHDDAVGGFGGDFQTSGEGFAAREQRVIATHLKLFGQAFEDSDAAVADGGRLAVHGVVENAELAAKGFHNALQAETNAEDRDAITHGGENQVG